MEESQNRASGSEATVKTCSTQDSKAGIRKQHGEEEEEPRTKNVEEQRKTAIRIKRKGRRRARSKNAEGRRKKKNGERKNKRANSEEEEEEEEAEDEQGVAHDTDLSDAEADDAVSIRRDLGRVWRGLHTT